MTRWWRLARIPLSILKKVFWWKVSTRAFWWEVRHEIQPVHFANLFRKKIRLILTIGSFAVALFLLHFSRS